MYISARCVFLECVCVRQCSSSVSLFNHYATIVVVTAHNYCHHCHQEFDFSKRSGEEKTFQDVKKMFDEMADAKTTCSQSLQVLQGRMSS